MRWLVAFTLLMFVSTAVPVLADSSADETALVGPEGQPMAGFPSGKQVAEGLQEADLAEAKEEAERETAAAGEEREDSLEAFSGASSSEAMDLLKSEFSEQLAMIDRDPVRMLSDASIEQVLSPTAARVIVNGAPMLIDGTIPVRAPTEEGDLKKVDLDLESNAGGFTQVNPLSEVTLPDSAADGIGIGDEGLAVEPLTTEGESSATPLSDKDVFYPETQTDTDLLVMPMANGVELFSQLRSVDSPEELRFALSVPEGAVPRSDGEGGAEVFDEGEAVAAIPAPTAVDAQGAEVPVEMHLDGAELVLEVPHRSMDVAYPLLVDPIVDESYGNLSWYAGYNLAALSNGTWAAASSDWGRFLMGTTPQYSSFEGSNRGLFISAKSTAENQWAYKSAEWRYTTPGSTTYIVSAGVSPFWRHNQENCPASKYPEPHDYIGLWSPSWSPQYGWMYLQNDAAQTYKFAWAEPPTDWRKITAQWFIIGLGTGIYNTAPLPCYRDLYVGGAYVWMDDVEAPTLGQVSGMPSGWVSDKTEFTISASASDAGLGVQYATLFPEGAGYIESPAKQSQCTGLRASPCPASREFQFKLTGSSFDEGKKWAQLSVADALGKVSATAKWEMWVDRTPPEVSLEGQFAKATHETGTDEQDPEKWEDLSQPTYNLTIKATDGSKKEGKTMRSGVKNIEIFLDGKKETVPWGPLASCSESSCSMEKIYPVTLTGLALGKHTLKVIAVDFVGKERIREIEFEYFPATGMKDEYVLQHFPLPDGQGNENEEEFPDRPELAVNVMNGNLVYRQKDVEVDGSSADLEVERYYNSQLPTAENTEWGDGWTLAETPDLEPKDTGGSPAPDVAELLDSSGAIEDGVQLPTEVGKTSFDPTLQATLTKEAGGYALSDETGGSAGEIVFDESGRTEELRTGEYAAVDYDYEGGALEEIAVKDPATASSAGLPAIKSPAYASAFGALGSGNGQLKAPGDVAVDASGNLYVVDKGNNRIEKFNPKGEYLTKFGALGSANGQLNRPTALAIDSKGSVWVADSDNNRIQEFSSSGTYLAKFGSAGTGNGQFAAPEGIAIDPEGNIWVADTHNGRLQKFSAAGAFLKVIGSKGSGAGQLGEPKAIDTTASGAVWATDWQYNRVAEFGAGGEFMRQFGSAGTGDGQFEHPAAIDVGSEGLLWVADQGNNRIQRFNEGGAYLTKFGSKGSGSGQFSLASPMGIAVENSGNVWIADPANNRIQKWIQSPAAEEDDPSVELNVEGGLVRGLEGEEAGTRSYSYSGDDLTSQTGPLGKTTYKYDTAGRMTEVTLPNKTYAVIAYDAIGRVKSVVVAPGGTGAKTSYFEYKDEPRSTTVLPAGKPAVFYSIGEDGSVFKWWNTEKPPTIDNIAGSLYEERGEVHPTPIGAGDKNLTVQAYSPEGINSIEVIANGSTLVNEVHCAQDPAKAGLECVSPAIKAEWVTNTSNHPPGNLNLEVIATDRLEHVTAQRLWVNIPVPPPPPPPGSIVPPTFEEVLHFREEFGLDVWEPVEDQLDLNDRVWNVLGAWHNPETPEGQVARASWEKWGMPMRNVDVAEMEYRERYIEIDGEVIKNWAESHFPSTYAGYYVDHRAGGIIHIGFTSGQEKAVEELKSSASSLEAANRLTSYPATPGHSFAELASLQTSIGIIDARSAPLRGVITRVGLGTNANAVTVHATSPTVAASQLAAHYGAQAPITVYQELGQMGPTASRWTDEGAVLSGQAIGFWPKDASSPYYCTAGFGTSEKTGKTVGGQNVVANFTLTAGHCFPQDFHVRRFHSNVDKEPDEFGVTNRVAINHLQDEFVTDGEAIRLSGSLGAPDSVYRNGRNPLSIKGVANAKTGMPVCMSGVKTDRVQCGKITGPAEIVPFYPDEEFGPFYEVPTDLWGEPGDSGAPVWVPGSNFAIGLNVFGGSGTAHFTPLSHPEMSQKGFYPWTKVNADQAPGLLHAPMMGDMHVTVVR